MELWQVMNNLARLAWREGEKLLEELMHCYSNSRQ